MEGIHVGREVMSWKVDDTCSPFPRLPCDLFTQRLDELQYLALLNHRKIVSLVKSCFAEVGRTQGLLDDARKDRGGTQSTQLGGDIIRCSELHEPVMPRRVMSVAVVVACKTVVASTSTSGNA